MHQLPGTNLEGANLDCQALFQSIFSTGGLVLSQVCTITGLEPHTVQNWVKRKFVAPPKDKKYSQNQLCRIICINLLKDALPLDVICGLLAHINGVLAVEDDDLIADSQLYFYFVQVLVAAQGNAEANAIHRVLQTVLAQGHTLPPQGKQRLAEVLEIMVMAYLSVQYKQQALLLYKTAQIDTDWR